MKSQSREIGSLNYCIVFKFVRRLGSPAIGQFHIQILRLRDFPKSYDKKSYRILKQGLAYHCVSKLIEHLARTVWWPVACSPFSWHLKFVHDINLWTQDSRFHNCQHVISLSNCLIDIKCPSASTTCIVKVPHWSRIILMCHANSSIFTFHFSHAHSELWTGWSHESNLITAITENVWH